MREGEREGGVRMGCSEGGVGKAEGHTHEKPTT